MTRMRADRFLPQPFAGLDFQTLQVNNVVMQAPLTTHFISRKLLVCENNITTSIMLITAQQISIQWSCYHRTRKES